MVVVVNLRDAELEVTVGLRRGHAVLLDAFGLVEPAVDDLLDQLRSLEAPSGLLDFDPERRVLADAGSAKDSAALGIVGLRLSADHDGPLGSRLVGPLQRRA